MLIQLGSLVVGSFTRDRWVYR